MFNFKMRNVICIPCKVWSVKLSNLWKRIRLYSVLLGALNLLSNIFSSVPYHDLKIWVHNLVRHLWLHYYQKGYYQKGQIFFKSLDYSATSMIFSKQKRFI